MGNAVMSADYELKAECRPTLTVSLEQKIARLQAEMDNLNKALSIVKAHPEVQEVLDVVSSIRRLL